TTDPNYAATHIGKAAILVRYRQGAEAFAVALTGTTSIVGNDAADHRRDCLPMVNFFTSLNGRLAWNGDGAGAGDTEAGSPFKYGAYFNVHGCAGDFQQSSYGNKLVYLDDDGNWLPGGWDWGCSASYGVRLLPEPDVFTSLCIAERSPFPGLDLVLGG